MLNIPEKLLEGQMCEIIDKHMENHELISDKLWEFRKGRLTEGVYCFNSRRSGNVRSTEDMLLE